MASTRNSEKRLAALVEDDDEEAGQALRPSFADGQPGGKPLSSADQEAQKEAARRSLEKEIDELVRVRLAQAFSAAPGVAGGEAAGASGVTGEFAPFTPEGSVVDSQEPAFGFLDGSGGLAAAINRAVAIAGRQDQEGELDPFRNHLPACSCSACLALSLLPLPYSLLCPHVHESSSFRHKFSFCPTFLW